MKITLSLLLCSCMLTPVCLCAQQRFDVIIHEFMADPSPAIGLPGSEWIELKNNSGTAINLQQWRIADATGQSNPLPAYLLQPDSMVIVCTGSAVAALSVFGSTIAVSNFPTLDNESDLLSVKAPNGMTVHALQYNSSWYRNEVKREGGWSLEMMDSHLPCGGQQNWKASDHPAGGTPGRKNSTDTTRTDLTGPQLLRSFSADSSTIVLLFDEPLDSLSGATVSNYSIDNGLQVLQAITVPPLFTQVQLKLNTHLQWNTIYQVQVNNTHDCKGNAIRNGSTVKAGRAGEALWSDIVINELLFNPRSGGEDYIECYNRSHKVLDLSGLSLANRNSNRAISNIKAISNTPFYIYPGEYVVFASNPAQLALDYFVQAPDRVISMTTLPSLPDEEGYALLLNTAGVIVDEVPYSEKWHFKLIDNPEGVALERISPEGFSPDQGNWHSAASTAGYGTPGYKNSQYLSVHAVPATIAVQPAVFSPDNDGRDDVAAIQYSVTAPGYIANMVIYDAGGRPVRYLVRNGLLGLSGQWTWDGLDEKKNKLPVGRYIVFTEIFNLEGKKQSFKNVIVLARPLH
ncbi:MAG: lamin tail domain-containing protein [Chitinophagales bacterium]|nr:lamin tail domain-containing protein [Chitinophagales bacterium]